MLSQLASAPISADVAADTARELFEEGWRTPRRLLESTWQQRVDALGRGGYRRYDESTATRLEVFAHQVLDDHGGDLRRPRPASHDDVGQLEKSLQQLPGIGPTGAAIFCREVQAVWPEVRPYFDDRAVRAARELRYSTDPRRLEELAPSGETARLSAALVRWSLTG
ncbi:MAG: endonuclease [Nocardioides sp.]